MQEGNWHLRAGCHWRAFESSEAPFRNKRSAAEAKATAQAASPKHGQRPNVAGKAGDSWKRLRLEKRRPRERRPGYIAPSTFHWISVFPQTHDLNRNPKPLNPTLQSPGF